MRGYSGGVDGAASIGGGVDHGHGDGVRLPCLLHQMSPGPLSLVVLPSFVVGKFSVTQFMEDSLLVCWCQGGGTTQSTMKKDCVKPQGTEKRCVFSCPI